jgi:hypothetical protein
MRWADRLITVGLKANRSGESARKETPTVRCGSIAGVGAPSVEVRFAPGSGHPSAPR